MPGPGQYAATDAKKVKEMSPSWSMGTSKRETEKKTTNIPGPGAYDPKKKVIVIIKY